jgi:putative ABC transport system permease protein
MMWRNYLLIAARSLAKSRLFTALNLVGLAVGMAACLLIAMWVRNETTYDKWLPDVDRIFVVQANTQYPGKALERWGHTSAALLPKMLPEYPQIVAGTRFLKTERTIRLGDRLEGQSMVLVDAGFFDTLALPLLAGDPKLAIKRPDHIVVNQRFTRKWFGDIAISQVLGQTLTVTVKGEKRPYQIAAIFGDLPSNSIFEFDVVMPLVDADIVNPQSLLGWGNFSAYTVLKLKNAADADIINQNADTFVSKYVPDFVKVESGFYYRPVLQNITNVHLQGIKIGSYFKPSGDERLVMAIAATGLLILIIAMITYINLATARVSVRAREVGLRKTLGAQRHHLLTQFLTESTLLAALAGLLALAIVELSLPLFNQLLELRLPLFYWGLQGTLLPLVVMVVVVGVIGGWYPALVMTRLRPREALSGSRGAVGGGRLRVILVIAQFSVAVLLMTSMIIIYTQVSYMRKADMGYQPEGLVVVSQLQRAEIKPQIQNLIDALKRVGGVTSVTRSMFDPTGGGLARQPAYLDGVPDAQAPTISVNPIDWNYVKTYGARLIAGRDLDEKFGEDNFSDNLSVEEMVKRGGNILINREALKFFNTTDPKAVLGKTFRIVSPLPGQRTPVTIVGVIEDIRMRSARDEVLPAFYIRSADMLSTASVQFQGVAPSEMMPRLEAAWKMLFPETPFRAKLVDEAIESYYKAEQRRGNLFALFAGIAIVLCAAGLYGLAVFTAERRTKEIGIRKVLGASITDIVKLLVWQFSKPVMIATLIAWPIAWWLMRDWLNGFNVRIALTPIPFIAAGLLAMVIAWLTVTWHAIRVARTSPIHALRYE